MNGPCYVELRSAAITAKRQPLGALLHFDPLPMASPDHMAMPDAVLSEALTDDLAAARQEPTSEGLILMGTPLHASALLRAQAALCRHFRQQPGLLITTHLPLCDDPQDRRRHVIPDLVVANGSWDPHAPSYHLWEAPTPHFVLEIASRSTVDRDLGFKKWEYERLGVLEYWQLDQSGELLPKPLLGHRLSERGYQELRPHDLVDGREAYYSAALGLLLRSRGHGLGLELVFRDPQSGKDILVGEQMDQALHVAERAAEAERNARLAAEGAAEAATQATESERRLRLAVEERLARAEEALRRVPARPGSDLD